MNAERKNCIAWIVLCIIVIMIGLVILLKPKVDYESMNNDIMEYVNGLENIKEINSDKAGIYKLTLEDSTWYAAEEKDKAGYCLAVNTTITAICQKYKALKEVQRAQIFYYDESGVLIAEPSDKSYTLESKILY